MQVTDPQQACAEPGVGAGYVVAGRYELLRLIGRGSMGEVWVAHHRSLREDVALKLLTHAPLTREFESRATVAARFRFEAQVAARLSRKTRHIVRVTDHGEEDGLAYLVMELLEGETLEWQLLHRGTLPLEQVAKLIRQTARALEEAHSEGVVHRDLKPANIFLTRDEEGGLLVKLLDFGIARMNYVAKATPPFSTADGLVCGTPGYMSPEQARASKVDPRSDLWALATVAYEALTGSLPVASGSMEELLENLQAGRIIGIRERNPELPSGLDAFFARAFHVHIEERFTSAVELASAFDQATGQVGSLPRRPCVAAATPRPPITTLTRFAPWGRAPLAKRRRARGPVLAIVGFAAALLTVAATGTIARMSSGATLRDAEISRARPAGTDVAAVGTSEGHSDHAVPVESVETREEPAARALPGCSTQGQATDAMVLGPNLAPHLQLQDQDDPTLTRNERPGATAVPVAVPSASQPRAKDPTVPLPNVTPGSAVRRPVDRSAVL